MQSVLKYYPIQMLRYAPYAVSDSVHPRAGTISLKNAFGRELGNTEVIPYRLGEAQATSGEFH